MRMLFSVLGLVLVLAIVGVLARKQLSPAAAPAASGASAAPTPAQQGRRVQENVQQQVESLMQQPRPMPDEGQ